MKIMAAVLLVLLLVVVPIFSQQNCQKEPEKKYYFIYNASVELKAYYCSNSDKEDSYCKYSNHGKLYERNNIPLDLPQNCWNKWSGIVRTLYSVERIKPKLCEFSVPVNMLDNTVKFSNNSLCLYRNGTCYNKNISKYVFWNVQDTCESLVLIANGDFSIWTDEQRQTKFISDNNTSLILREKIELCGIDRWKTNYDGIIASKIFSLANQRFKRCPNLHSNFDEFCDNHHTTADTSTSTVIRKMWYVYEYPPNVTISMCFTNFTDTCEGKNLVKAAPKDTLDLQTQCANNFCKSSSCNYESKTVICQTTTQVDLENDLVRWPPGCRYSDGLSEPFQAFWEHKNRCKDIRKAYQGYEQHYEAIRLVTGRNNSTLLFLLRQGSLCGQTVWYTDQDGLVASDEELEFLISEVSSSSSHQSQRSSSQPYPAFQEKAKIPEYFIIAVLSMCFLWIGFKIAVCVIYLSTNCKKKEKVPAVAENIYEMCECSSPT